MRRKISYIKSDDSGNFEKCIHLRRGMKFLEWSSKPDKKIRMPLSRKEKQKKIIWLSSQPKAVFQKKFVSWLIFKGIAFQMRKIQSC